MKNDGIINHNFYFFISAGRKWGVDIGAIREVGELTDSLCPVPHSQYSVMGYLNVRGDIHQLISFNSLIAGKRVEENKGGLVLFFKENIGQSFGVYVDDACEIMTVNNVDIEKWEAVGSGSRNNEFDMSEYLTSSVYRSKDELVPLIDPTRIESAINI